MDKKEKEEHKYQVLFITDGITKQEASVELFPTLDMIGYYFTNTLRGYQFVATTTSFLVSMGTTSQPTTLLEEL